MIKVNMSKARVIAHAARRRMRAIAFAPLDIKATRPDKAKKAEADRVAVRKADAKVQASINAADSADALKSVMMGADLV